MKALPLNYEIPHERLHLYEILFWNLHPGSFLTIVQHLSINLTSLRTVKFERYTRFLCPSHCKTLTQYARSKIRIEDEGEEFQLHSNCLLGQRVRDKNTRLLSPASSLHQYATYGSVPHPP